MVDENVKNTSTVVVALPAEDEQIHEIGPEQKHATLLWFGEIDDHTAGWVNAQILKLIYEEKVFPLSQTTRGVHGLGEDEPQAQVVGLVKHEGSGLDAIRNMLLESEEVREAWESVEQYPSYTPHVTLGYGDEVTEEDKSKAESLNEIRFNRLALWHKDKQIEYPLDGREETVVAAGTRIVRTQEGSKRFGVPIGSEITVDSNGKVTKVKKATVQTSGRGASTPPRPDPNRKPSKFVATRPGQKAKIPSSGGIAGGNSSGLSSDARDALTSWTKIRNVLGKVSAAQREAMTSLTQRRKLSDADKAALRSMIEQILKKMAEDRPNKKSESKSKSKSKSEERSDAQKKATEKAREASSKSTSSAKKQAQAKSQKAASEESAWIRSLKAAYAALGGDPSKLPNVGDKSTSSSSSKPVPQQGFSSMTDKELTSAIRSLVMEKRNNPSSVVLNALRKAKSVRDRRALLKHEKERRREKFLDKAGA